MATKRKAKTNASALSLIRKAGFADKISKQKTKLWEIEEEIATLSPDQFDFYVSQKFDGNCFVIVREGDESVLVPFITGQIDGDDYDVDDDNGLVRTFDEEVSLVLVRAQRDDEELGITEGDTNLRAVLA